MKWLRTQGQMPQIAGTSGTFYAIIARRKRMLSKNMTLVALFGLHSLPVTAGDWELSPVLNLRKSHQIDMGTFSPETLANCLEGIFNGLPWERD